MSSLRTGRVLAGWVTVRRIAGGAAATVLRCSRRAGRKPAGRGRAVCPDGTGMRNPDWARRLAATHPERSRDSVLLTTGGMITGATATGIARWRWPGALAAGRCRPRAWTSAGAASLWAWRTGRSAATLALDPAWTGVTCATMTGGAGTLPAGRTGRVAAPRVREPDWAGTGPRNTMRLARLATVQPGRMRLRAFMITCGLATGSPPATGTGLGRCPAVPASGLARVLAAAGTGACITR
jgi:hypothetical protein